jgi:hypothetical protein
MHDVLAACTVFARLNRQLLNQQGDRLVIVLVEQMVGKMCAYVTSQGGHSR